MTTKIEGVSLELRYHSNGIDWTLYLTREDTGTGSSVAYSSVYPGVPGEDVAGSWVAFLGLDGFETAGR